MNTPVSKMTEGAPTTHQRPVPSHRVSMPAYCKELWDLIYSYPEPSYGSNQTRLVTIHRGNFDWTAWSRSIEHITARHPVLIARVAAVPNGLEFVLDAKSPPTLRVIDLSSSSIEDRWATARTIAYKLTWEPFEAKDGRLFRTFGIRVSDSECVLGIIIHHLIGDGWSMEIVGRELLTAYIAEVSGKPFTLPKPAVGYLDYIRWMDDWLQKPEGKSQAAFWARQLTNPPSMYLPMEHIVDFDAMARISFETFTLESGLVRALSQQAAKSRTTPFVILLSAAFVALSAIIGSRDLGIGIIAEQRNSNRLRNTVGCIFNLLTIRTEIDLNDSFEQAIAQVRLAYLEACKNQSYPLLANETCRRPFPFFQFRRLAPEGSERPNDDIGFSPLDLPERPPWSDCARHAGVGYGLGVEHRGDVMRGRAYYLPTLYTQKTALRLVQTFYSAIEMTACRSNDAASTLLRPRANLT